MPVDKDQVEQIVRLIIGRDECYAWNASVNPDGEHPLTADHVFGQHVLVMRERETPLSLRSAEHLEQRVRAIAASTIKDM